MTNRLSQQLSGVRDDLMRNLEARGAHAAPGARAPAKLDPRDQALLAELASAMKQWLASPDCEAFVAGLDGMGIGALRAGFDGALRSPEFAQVRELSREAVSLNLIPKSISIGLDGELALLAGFYGSIGYIHDLDLSNSSSAIYLLAGGGVGVDKSVALGGQVGIWMNAVDDVGGSYTAGELEVGDFLDLAGFVLLQDEDFKGAMIDIDGGESAGIEGLELEMLTLGVQHYPVAQPTASNMIILELLQCFKTGSLVGHDEVYLTFTIDGGSTIYRYPTWSYFAMDADLTSPQNVWVVGRSVWCNSEVEVSVYDSDGTFGINADDMLASYTIKVSDFSGTGTANQKTQYYNQGGADYALTACLMDLNA